jgi:hypothetical protein
VARLYADEFVQIILLNYLPGEQAGCLFYETLYALSWISKPTGIFINETVWKVLLNP